MLVVLDTSVMVAAARSRNGASFEIVRQIGSGAFQPALSIALYAEWRDALTRPENLPSGVSASEARDFVRFVASQCHVQPIYFMWRPWLPDADDDMILELAVAASCRFIITHNVRDFIGSERFGIETITPSAFLQIIRSKS